MALNQCFKNSKFASTSKPQLMVDEVEKVQRQQIASLVGHVFQLTYAGIFDSFIQEEKVNHCPIKRQHTCVMMDSEDGWFYYHDSEVLKTAKSMCDVFAFKLGQSWEVYVLELPNLPWTSIYLTSLELESFGEIIQPKELQKHFLYAIYYGPCGLKCKDFNGMKADKDPMLRKL